MPTDFDSWLAQLNPNNLASEITEFEAELLRIQGEITRRRQALSLYKQWVLSDADADASTDGDGEIADGEPTPTPGSLDPTPTPATSPSPAPTVAPPPTTPSALPTPASPPEAANDDAGQIGMATHENEIARIVEGDERVHVASMDEKRRILLEILRERPTGIHVKEIRSCIAARNVVFDGTPERGVLWRMEQRREIVKLRQGFYALPSTEAVEAGA